MTTNTQPLDKPLSLYLDVVRFIAASLVVMAHYLQYGIVQGPLARFMPDMGREAVIMFFVLSGFVIAYTTEYKQQGARDYVVARCARIYSVAAPVLLLAFLCAAMASKVLGADIPRFYEVAKAWVYLPFHLLFAGELWTMSDTPPWLGQYWSLGYEVWYYVLFGVVFYLRGARRLAIGALAFAVLGYKLWLLLPVWLSGVLLYHWQKKVRMPRTAARIGWLLTVALLLAYNHAGAEAQLRAVGRAIWPFPGLPLGSADRFLGDYLVCLIIFTNFLCARHAGFGALLRLAAPIRTLSSYTFTLYLAHGLVLGAWRTFYPADGSAGEFATVTAAIALFTWTLGQLTEQRKHLFQAFFERCINVLRPAAPERAASPADGADSVPSVDAPLRRSRGGGNPY